MKLIIEYLGLTTIIAKGENNGRTFVGAKIANGKIYGIKQTEKCDYTKSLNMNMNMNFESYSKEIFIDRFKNHFSTFGVSEDDFVLLLEMIYTNFDTNKDRFTEGEING